MRLYRFTGAVGWLRAARLVVDALAEDVERCPTYRVRDAIHVAVLAQELRGPEWAALPLLDRGPRSATGRVVSASR